MPPRYLAEVKSPLSACVITLDEEERLGACLDGVRGLCDDVVVVDCGSTDRTVEIARAHGARVLRRDWPGMVAQKNRAIDAAQHDWVLSVDADERVTADLRASIRRVLDRDDAARAAGYEMAWETWFLGGRIRSDRGRARWKLRLFDRRRGRWVGEDPHGHVALGGRVERLGGKLRHRPYQDLAHHAAKLGPYTTAAAASLADQRRSVLFGLIVRPPAAFVRTYLLRGGILDGGRGFVSAALTAYYVFVKYAKLSELRRAR